MEPSSPVGPLLWKPVPQSKMTSGNQTAAEDTVLCGGDKFEPEAAALVALVNPVPRALTLVPAR